MKRLLFSGVAIAAIAVAAPALAADMPVAPSYKAPVMAPPPPTWTGWYLGLNAGYGWGSFDVPTVSSGVTEYKTDGWVAGGQLGFNYQVGQFVWGLEADINWTDMNDSKTFVPANRVGRELDYFGTVRGRVGAVFDNVMFYGTGGWAYGRGSASSTLSGTAKEDHSGWVAGAGIEWMYSPNWIFGVEYLHVDLGKENYTFSDGSLRQGDLDADIVRARVSYKF